MLVFTVRITAGREWKLIRLMVMRRINEEATREDL